MTAWSFPSLPGRLIELDGAECRRLIGSVGVGRLGYSTPRGPRVVPLNHALLPEAVTFRTTASGEIAAHALGQTVAFEVDDLDAFLRSGWSVLVVGTLRTLSPEAVGLLSVRQSAEPWADGERPLVCGIEMESVTGRRVLPT